MWSKQVSTRLFHSTGAAHSGRWAVRRAMIVGTFALSLQTTPVAAQEIPAHTCTPPARPEKLDDIEKINKFAQALGVFQKCIAGYAKAHEATAKRHTEAANAAIGEWNTFVKSINASQPQQPAEKTDNN
jgi:hypothetical protein